MAGTETNIPPKCPACGRLTVDNDKHCPPTRENPGKWAKSCLTIVCRRCGSLYRAGAHHQPKPPPTQPGRSPQS